MSVRDRLRLWLDPPPAQVPQPRSSPAAADGPLAGPETLSQEFQPRRPDHVDSAVREWLGRELPRLEADRLLSSSQVRVLAARYGVELPRPTHQLDPSPTTERAAGPLPSASSPKPSLAPFLSDHGVSIILYLGAFLVVISVAIYLGYNWGSVQGTVKLGALIALTAAFLGAAWLCLARPSVRPAGQTFLFVGAVLIPANFAAAYSFVFAHGPTPESFFWLVGSVASGLMWGALAIRLDSRVYGALAALAAPVAAASAVSLAGLGDQWQRSAASLAVATSLVLTGRHEFALARSVRLVGLILAPLLAPFLLDATRSEQPASWASAVALLSLVAAIAGVANRRDGSWVAGVALAFTTGLTAWIADIDSQLALGQLLIMTIVGGFMVIVARRLSKAGSLGWDIGGAALAWFAALQAWDLDRYAVLFVSAAAGALVFIAIIRRSPNTWYLAFLGIDLAYIKIVESLGTPESPVWTLGLALWPIAMIWWCAAAGLSQRWAPPFWAAALLTGVGAAILVWDQNALAAAMALSYAAASVLTAWRQRQSAGLLASAAWLMLAAYQGSSWLLLPHPWTLSIAGLAAWPVLGACASAPRSPTWRPFAFGAATGAGLLAAIATSLAPAFHKDFDVDVWLVAVACAWLDVALVVGTIGFRIRSSGAMIVAALLIVPAAVAGIARLHPTDLQAYALPIGLYLLVAAYLARLRASPQDRWLTSVLAGLGSAALLLPGLVQSLGGRMPGHALLTACEGLALAGWGMAVRWRPLIVAGLVAVVVIAAQQLFDAVYALPSWALLGGAGLALLAGAVCLLLLRDRLKGAREMVADRWASWS